MRPLLRALARVPDPLSDAALLARYAADRDPAAFEVLVWRHGGMVLGVCRRHLRDAHAAEDAFQATFLVLARKAGSVRGDTLPGFLHRVARRVAGRAAVKARRRRETPLTVEPPSRSVADGELAAVLDAEIDRLPDRQRQVVVLCYLDGESTEAAAARLGIPRGTVLSRLHAARATLAARLTRRGVTPPAVGLAAVLTAEQVAGGVRAAGGGFGPATILANEVLAMSGRKTVLAVAVGLVLAGGAGTGVGVLNAQNGGLPRVEAKPAAQAERQRRLDDFAPQVEKMLSMAQDRLQRLTIEAAELVDVSALQAGLAKLDVRILEGELQVQNWVERVKQAEVDVKRVADSQADDRQVQYLIDNDEEVKALVRIAAGLRDRYKSTARSTEPEAKSLALAKEKLDAAEKRLADRQAAIRPDAVKTAREQATQGVEGALRSDRSQLANAERLLKADIARRVELVKRIAAHRAKFDQLRLAEDEVQVARELRRAVIRAKAQAELGLDLPVSAATTDDRLEVLARQLSELRVALSTPDGGSRLDAIEQTLQQIRNAPGVRR